MNISSSIQNIPNFERFIPAIQRTLSGESPMESANQPLTEDQLTLRQLNREMQSLDNRSLGQIARDMQNAQRPFMDYWTTNHPGQGRPARFIHADGTFTIINSAAERDEFLNTFKRDWLTEVLDTFNSLRGNSGFQVPGSNIDESV
ncbi:MAG: hypothetical protein FWC13_13060 [Oscillospiraceae bacterium]|nr:hypothetical protein [Oscillospiraceae bacterium]